jgi:hypothetical protein
MLLTGDVPVDAPLQQNGEHNKYNNKSNSVWCIGIHPGAITQFKRQQKNSRRNGKASFIIFSMLQFIKSGIINHNEIVSAHSPHYCESIVVQQ